ncbi:24676_t:CDS:2, partial [Racocetra persica]
MEEVCDAIRSQKGGTKLNIKGYLMVKEKNKRGRYYWYCEYRKSKKCPSHATIYLIKNLHYLQDDSGKHNHLHDASHYMFTISNNVQPFMPSQNVLHEIIVRSRKTEQLPQSQDILDLIILFNL